jgi:hypothetical protein
LTINVFDEIQIGGGLKMKKMSIRSIAIALLALVVCFTAPQPALSSTIVTVNTGGTFINIASFNFSILGPSGTTADDNYTATLPAHWTDMSSGSVISAFSNGTSWSLTSGAIGSFNVDNVVLGGWVFGNQSSVSFVQGVDFFVSQVGGNYVVSGSAVPIPAAVWLLGSGLVGLIGLRRRMRK